VEWEGVVGSTQGEVVFIQLVMLRLEASRPRLEVISSVTFDFKTSVEKIKQQLALGGVFKNARNILKYSRRSG
jgi:hypothetical protein